MIAIIAILASMLLPALNKAREKAHSAQCLNNLKTIATGSLFYADSNVDFSPPGSSAGHLEHATNAIAPYIGMNTYRVNIWGRVGNSFARDAVGTDALPTKPFVCPSSPDTRMPGNYWHLFGKDGISYSINGSIGAVYYFPSSNGPILAGRKLTQVRNPSRKVYYFDHLDAGIPCAPYIDAVMNHASYRHGDRINLAYVDGHCGSFSETLAQEDIYNYDK